MQLRDATGESAQIFRRQGDWRVCVASAERPIGLRDTIPVGTQLSMKAGSAAQVLLAWEDHDRLLEGLQAARFTPTVLAGVRRRGWGQSLGEREPGSPPVSAPVGALRPGDRRRVHPARLSASPASPAGRTPKWSATPPASSPRPSARPTTEASPPGSSPPRRAGARSLGG